MDLDKSGHGFQRVRTYLGPSLGWKDELVQPTTDILVGGTYNVQPGDSLLLVEVAAAVTINLPDVIKWVQQANDQPATSFERSITVKDIGGNAANFNIVIAPFGQQGIDNLQQSYLISTARAVVKLVPLIDLSGWAIAAISQTGGGGGGGGDVFKAGNNTFTGTNDFQSTATAVTPPTADNTQKIATTAFVKVQGYLMPAALVPYALIASPTFTGNPQAPTPSPGDNTISIATTAFVTAALGSFSGGAPIAAPYVTFGTDATLSNERVLTTSATITVDTSVAGQIKLNSSAGGGNVSNVGTPAALQYGRWVTATTIEGVAPATVRTDIGAQPLDAELTALAGLASSADTMPYFTGVGTAALTNFTASARAFLAGTTNAAMLATLGGQPLDGDLTAISALSGTNTIYYRSATDIWSPVTFSGLSFSGGILTVTAGGGNVNTSGSPTVNQFAQWTDGTHIQGISAAATLTAIGAQPLDQDLTDLAAIAGVRGDIIYRGASAWLKLGAGTSGQVLQSGGAGADPSWVTPVSTGSSIGKHTIWVPAGGMIPRITNGPQPNTIELATNKIIVNTLDFDTTTQEFAQFSVAMPKSWDAGTLTFIAVWSHVSTATNFGVVWAVEAVAKNDNVGLDSAFGTAVQVTDTGGTANNHYISPESGTFTALGAAASSVIIFQVKRIPADASDNLAVDARLHGIKIIYTASAGTDN